MPIVLRKLFTLLLLVVVLLQITGAYFVFKFQQTELKLEMKHYLSLHPENPSITTFEFTLSKADQLQWEDENEFKYKGEMYDVITRKVVGDKLVIQCIADKKETKLLKSFEEIMKHQSRGSKNRTMALHQLLHNLFEPVSTTFQLSPFTNETVSYLNYTSSLSDNITEIITPPPKVC